MILDSYLSYLNEDEKKEIKIHPKRKTTMSYAVSGPFDDIAVALAGGGNLLKKGIPIAIKAKKAGASSATTIGILYGYKVIRSFFDKCVKQCGALKMNNPVRQLCLLKCKKVFLQKEIVLFKKHNKIDKANKSMEKLKIVNKKIVLYQQYIKKNKKPGEK